MYTNGGSVVTNAVQVGCTPALLIFKFKYSLSVQCAWCLDPYTTIGDEDKGIKASINKKRKKNARK